MLDQKPQPDEKRDTSSSIEVLRTSKGSHNAEGAPRVALMGWCDRAATIEGPHPAFAFTNIQGLSYSRVSHFFPFSLEGTTLIFGLYNPKAQESLSVEFRHSDDSKAFDLTLNVSQLQVFDPVSKQFIDATAVPLSAGWLVQMIQIVGPVLITRPDTLRAFLKGSDEDRFLASFHVLHASLPLYSPDQVAALRSDPLARRIVKVTYSCPECKSKFQTYAALERNQTLEDEGYAWFAQLGDEFQCSCGKMVFRLEYLRTGLHGLLSRSLAPDHDSAASYMRLYEITKLEQDCRKFKALLDANVSEEELQNFLEAHPIFFARFSASRLIHKPKIMLKYVADFAILNRRKELLLIEIERPSMRLLTKERRITADLQHAITQVRDWIQEVSDHKAAVLSSHGIELREVAVVKGVVVAGRSPADDEDARSLRRSFSDIDFYTYDDLLRDTTEIIRQIANA